MRAEAYELAKEQYASIGVDTDEAIRLVQQVPVSMHCWQGDDIHGFEQTNASLDGGLATTGNYPGRARSISELKSDIEYAFSLIPGKKRLNVHAIYLDSDGGKVDRTAIEPKHYQTWVDFARKNKIGLDFNPTCFAHPMSADGFTLSHPDRAVREYWIAHCKASRTVAEYFARELNEPTVINHWLPDGFKDIPIDRTAARRRLMESLDEILAQPIDRSLVLDSLESKLFGIGAESATMGSSEFCLGYAITRGIMLTLDAGHFHPTEVISDKIGSVLLFLPQILLHVSRPVRWDSDHVIILDDELRAIAQEIIRGGFESRVHIGLDYFDASINRIAAWTIGMRNMQKALLLAYLEPTARLREMEINGNYTDRLSLLEEYKTMPFGAVFERYCEQSGVPAGSAWLDAVHAYETGVLAKRI